MIGKLHVRAQDCGRLSFLAKDTMVFGVASIANKAVGLLTFPLLTRYYSVAEYGFINYFAVLAGLITTALVFGQDSAIARYFFEETDINMRRAMISQSFLLQAVVLILVLPFLWLCTNHYAHKLHNADEAGFILKLILCQVPFQLLLNFSLNILKWSSSRDKFLFLSLAPVLSNLVLIIMALFVLKAGVAAPFYVAITNAVIFGLVGLHLIRRWLIKVKSLNMIRRLLLFGTPYGVICTLGMLSPALERSIVEQLLGSDELGLYGAGTSIAMIAALITTAFQTAWGPFSMAIHKEPDATVTYNLALRVFVLGISVCVLLLSAAAPVVISVLASNRYLDAAVVVFPLALGLAIQATSWITEIGIAISKRSSLNIYAYLIFIITTILGISSLAPKFGLLGVASGLMIGHVAKAGIASWFAQRAYPLQWSYGLVSLCLFITFIIGTCGSIMVQHGLWFAATSLYIMGALTVTFLGWYKMFDGWERQMLLRVMHIPQVK